ncbi:AAA family ATPase [Lentimicrobium sp.]|uniref:AAA family ATPase n=1 Tax=Lentimicrobium sp. TaxID=2034841 RepID=UPI002C7FE4FF|nr:AAA family ATPase [Lentimicrobium sp.]HPJ63398.1 AAA family ATPase [Lentimicrobium sp.]
MQSDNYNICQAFPENEINQAWDGGRQIQGVAFGQNKWILLNSSRTIYGLQRWATNAAFPADEIKEGWDEGFDIIFLAYTGDRWTVILSKDSGFTDQIWRTSSRFPEKEIRQGIKDGYAITSLSYGVDRWAVVMSKGSNLKNQTFITTTDFPETEIAEGWNNGRDITSLAFGDGKWALVMSENTGYKTQSWATRNNFEEGLISDKAGAGNVITGLFHADGMWVYVFSVLPEIVDSGNKSSRSAGLPAAETPDDTFGPEAVELFETGRKYSENNEPAKAIPYFRKAIKLEPGYFSAYNSLGVALDETGKKDEALKCFQKAYELNRHNSIILSNLISQIADNEEPLKTVISLVEAAEPATLEGISSVSALSTIGKAYSVNGRHKKAAGFFRKALEIEPENDDLRMELGYEESHSDTTTASPAKPEVQPVNRPESIESLLAELNHLTGLEQIKRDIDALLKFIRVEKKRQERGIAVGKTTLHTVFAGPPGTGKTTMARLMGRMFKAMGLLKKGHVVEVDRSALVGEFIGQTAIKTNKVIDSALDGILFIDEAYALVPSDARNDFGEEAINILVKRMEDHKHNLVVIVAGYPDEMKRMIASNPGLQHRFTRYFYFDDYNPEQLTRIFKTICHDRKFILTPEAESKVMRYFGFLYRSRDKHFGNARTAGNLFEEAVHLQSARLALLDVDNLPDEALLTITVDDITASVQDEFEDKEMESLDDIMAELNAMVGLEEIKQNIVTLVNFIKTQQKLIATGYEADEISLHSVFFGPPGTGKTTVARLIGRIYKALGLLSKGHVVEVNRSHLVAEFVGQTAPKTSAVIDSAMHGILFIDEAYSLTPEKGGNDFGKEALEIILKRMDDERDKFAVIVAGYTAEMQQLIRSNAGLESRFNNYFYFNDYTPAELLEIFSRKIARRRFHIAPEALSMVDEFFKKLYAEKTESFGNGRMVRNFYEKIIKTHSNRVAHDDSLSRDEIVTFTVEDAAQAIGMMTSIHGRNQWAGNKHTPIGFNRK